MKKLAMPQVSLPQVDFQRLANDFRGLDARDPGMWPLAPRAAALLAVLVAVVAAGWWFDWRDQREQLAAKHQEELKLKDEFIAKKKQAVNLDEYKRQLVEIERAFGALLRQLPNKSEMESLLVDINQAGLGRGLQFDLFKPGSENIKDFYAELPITVRVTGNYHDFGAFVGDVAKLPRIVTLGQLNVDAVKEGGLKMDAIATTYRYLDEEEVAAQRRARAAAAKAKAKK